MIRTQIGSVPDSIGARSGYGSRRMTSKCGLIVVLEGRIARPTNGFRIHLDEPFAITSGECLS